MDYNFRSLVWLTVYFQTIFFSIHKLDSCMYIDQSHARTMLWYLSIIQKKILYNLLTHSHSIINNRNINIISVLFSFDCDLSAVIFVHISYSVINGIFQNWLDDQLNRTIFFYLFLYKELCLKTVFVTNFLNIHVTCAMLQLICDSDDGSSLRQTNPEQLRKL